MILVIQCAGSKRAEVGSFTTNDGRKVKFVSRPERAPLQSPSETTAHPDDRSDRGRTWRELLVDYNASGSNPLGLLKAAELYSPPAAPDVYRALVRRLGSANVFILSAGWGLIRSDFLTPDYDITFARDVLKNDPSKYRGPADGDRFKDLCQLPVETREDIVFVGSKSYLPAFRKLTNAVKARKIVYYNSAVPPSAEGCILKPFRSPNKRTWHYECAEAVSSQPN